jgi:hypothetical protein
MSSLTTTIIRVTQFALAAALVSLAQPRGVAAQTDYYNTDARRPVTVEDAYATERYAFELQLAPVKLERLRRGAYAWGFEPEIAYGILPRTHVELGLPIAFMDDAGGKRAGIAGLDIGLLHNLNTETRYLPALGIAAEVLAPVGSLAPDAAYTSLKGIATRTFTAARVHLNAQYTLGDDASGTSEVSRWLAGIAVDRTYPLNAMLVTAEVFASQPLDDAEDVDWNVGGGIRYQVDPRLAFDAGIGRRLTGDHRGWFITFGLARAFAIRALMPVGGR